VFSGSQQKIAARGSHERLPAVVIELELPSARQVANLAAVLFESAAARRDRARRGVRMSAVRSSRASRTRSGGTRRAPTARVFAVAIDAVARRLRMAQPTEASTRASSSS
jgi:hypothetical protein